MVALLEGGGVFLMIEVPLQVLRRHSLGGGDNMAAVLVETKVSLHASNNGTDPPQPFLNRIG